MATYAIGDIQGCYLTLQRLLERCAFDSVQDRLWLAGDLVNRGPRSLDVLRWAHASRERVTTILGNHDLNLLARAAGVRKAKHSDSLDGILNASDRDELLDWLRRQPFLHREGSFVMTHAGLLPGWTIPQAAELAHEVETALRGPDFAALLAASLEQSWDCWSDELARPDRLCVTLSALTRLRTCTPAGRMCLDFTGPPELAPPGCRPWFALRAEQHTEEDTTFLFGHWAALGLHVTRHAVGLDSACVYGRQLTAFRLEDREIIQVDCVD